MWHKTNADLTARRGESEDDMNILEYIDELLDQGYNEEDAERLADIAFGDEWEPDDGWWEPID